ncbi:MAG: DUF362 domain-containing protein [Sedimentisphaerales bacterium]|jgi:uncharacterized Fe-S center protein|nr:DUF362 domain-containing protein [Sedimentisphaerales bacterium]
MKKVYFIEARFQEDPSVLSEKARRLFKAGGFARCFRPNDLTAVKVHIGEDGNTTYIKAPCLKGLIEELKALKTKPFLTDTSTLYTGRRHNAVDHCTLAVEHGFCYQVLGAPFIPPDGLLGTAETSVRINGVLNKEVYIAYDIVRCQSIMAVAHTTGHLATGLGAVIKTLGMGCASRKGKMRQHAALKPHVKAEKCVACQECIRYCPESAIVLRSGKAFIKQDLCVGCAECVAVCRFEAVEYDWKQESSKLQQAMAEHALGAVMGKQDRLACFNFVISVTKDCDCFDTPDMPRIVQDIGILASDDPVAIDKAALDLIQDKTGEKIGKLILNQSLDPMIQLEHAARIGLGELEYELVTID